MILWCLVSVSSQSYLPAPESNCKCLPQSCTVLYIQNKQCLIHRCCRRNRFGNRKPKSKQYGLSALYAFSTTLRYSTQHYMTLYYDVVQIQFPKKVSNIQKKSIYHSKLMAYKEKKRVYLISCDTGSVQASNLVCITLTTSVGG